MLRPRSTPPQLAYDKAESLLVDPAITKPLHRRKNHN